MADTEFVRVRECPDGSHPEGDGVWIATRPSLDCGIASRQAFVAAYQEAGDDPVALDRAILRHLMVAFARFAPVRWNLHDAEHVTKSNPTGEWEFDTRKLVDDCDLGYVVADRADDLYRESVMRPLLEVPSTPSASGAVDGMTSAPTTSTGSRRRSSSRPASAGRRSGVHTP
jgi:hypothetical protein